MDALSDDTLALILTWSPTLPTRLVCRRWAACMQPTRTTFGDVLVSLALVTWALPLIRRDFGSSKDAVLLRTAVRLGGLAVLRHLHQHGLVVDDATAVFAAFDGHVHLLEWMGHLSPHPQCCAEDLGGKCWPSGVYEAAALQGHVHVLEWLPAFKDDAFLSVCAAHGGHLPVLRWLESRQRKVSQYAFFPAVTSGHAHVVKWMLARGFHWDTHDLDMAYDNEYWDMVAHMRAHPELRRPW